MAGRRDDSSLVINSNNVFAALGTLKKKKKNKDKPSSTKSTKGKSGNSDNHHREDEEKEKRVFWAPTPLTAKSWADVDDDEDDDYYATNAPPVSVWAPSPEEPKKPVENEELALEESETDDDVDEVDDEADEEIENESNLPIVEDPVPKKPSEAPIAPSKEAERQLSKKELKKKGLEELDAVLAELGYTKTEDSSQDETRDGQAKKAESTNNIEKKESVPGESKSAKKKKKKDKSSKEAKESQEQLGGGEMVNGTDAGAEVEKAEDVDVKEKLKKLALMKKKKSSKEMDAAAKAAASEAAARSAKLAAAKKKEKNHYNQQPVR